jgi:hypothetical protein
VTLPRSLGGYRFEAVEGELMPRLVAGCLREELKPEQVEAIVAETKT